MTNISGNAYFCRMEQQNPYIKQFPDLMSGKKIVYVHGFGSSGQSGTVQRMRTVLPEAEVIAPDLPVHPQEALSLLRTLCEREQPSLVVGTSMGGMYTEQLYGFDRIVINPAFRIADTMSEHGMTGKQQFFSPRQDGVQEFYVDKAMVKEYRAITEGNFAHADDPDEQHRIYGLFGDKDELVDTADLFPYFQRIPFHGEHRMNDHSFMHSVVPVIRWIDDRQEGRERPIVYIGTETLMQADGMPRPSMLKAVRQLIERYQVFFVAFNMTATRWPRPSSWAATPSRPGMRSSPTSQDSADSNCHEVLFTNTKYSFFEHKLTQIDTNFLRTRSTFFRTQIDTN